MHGRLGVIVALLVLLSAGLAGCVSDSDSDGEGNQSTGPGGSNTTPPTPGRVSGVVTDDRGMPLAGVDVQINRVFRSLTTGSDGSYSFEELPPATYRLTFLKEYYRRGVESVQVQSGATVNRPVALEPIMLAPGVPAAHGKMVDYVAALDVLVVGASLPGLPKISFTNETKENTFPGFWEIEPEPGYLVAHMQALVAFPKLVPELPDQGLGIQYFRGEDLLNNEMIEELMVEYHQPEPVLENEMFRMYQIENEDWEKWGPRTWQVGVFVYGAPPIDPFGGAILHTIVVRVILVEEDYVHGA